jgi:hypothetical protein
VLPLERDHDHPRRAPQRVQVGDGQGPGLVASPKRTPAAGDGWLS